MSNGQISSSIEDSIPPFTMSEMEARMSLNSILTGTTAQLNKVINTIRAQMLSVTGNLNSAIDSVMGSGTNYIKNIIASMTNREQLMNNEIGVIQQQFNDSKYDKCFVQNPATAFLNSSINGATKCVTDVLDTAQNTLNSLTTNINTVLSTLTGNSVAENCKNSMMGEWMCQQMQNTYAMTSLVSAAANISATSATAIVYFSSLPQTFIPCAVYSARFEKFAFNALRNVTNCVHSIMNAQ